MKDTITLQTKLHEKEDYKGLHWTKKMKKTKKRKKRRRRRRRRRVQSWRRRRRSIINCYF